MSFVTDQVRRIDAHLDRFQPRIARPSSRSSGRSLSVSNEATRSVAATTTTRTESAATSSSPLLSKRVELLESLIRTVTNATTSRKILPTAQLQQIVSRVAVSTSTSTLTSTKATASGNSNSNSKGSCIGNDDNNNNHAGESDEYGKELEWLLVSKLAAQVQGRLLSLLLDEITPVMDDIFYWDSVLGSYNYSALYMVQLFPAQLWTQGKEVVRDARENLRALRARGLAASSSSSSSSSTATTSGGSLAQEWRQFYGLVRDAIQERRLNDIQTRLFSPVNAARIKARSKLQGLNRQKQICAAAIGVLSNESLSFRRLPSGKGGLGLASNDEWKTHVTESVQLMSATMSQVSSLSIDPRTYESIVLDSRVEAEYGGEKFHQVYDQLSSILVTILPLHVGEYKEQRTLYGRPSRWIRYWLPAGALFLSSTTILRILVNRKADIVTWIRDFGKTTMAFWQNWVVDPVGDIIKTIRHDKGSEIALMSRESLESDRASLQRMVVDFAVENPETAGGPPLDDALVARIREKVREGDLTPVLRAYEHDLKKPFARAVTGNLVRELLIQIQKTKVDVEVAMSGIDSLLKSQELVFGLVGLTPGILASIVLGRWLSGLLGGRKGRTQGRLQGRLIRVIRNIDRILSNAEPQDHGLLTYKDHGLVLCEVQALQANSGRVLPGEINREFLEDLKDLTDIHLGAERHIKVVDRLRWAYWKWLN